MENPEKEISRAEDAPLFTDADFDTLEAFQKAAERAVGDNPHKDHIDFSKLDEQDMLLAERYHMNMIEAEELRNAIDYAKHKGLRSSEAFRGWLASLATVQIHNRGKINE